jgi:ferredoxin
LPLIPLKKTVLPPRDALWTLVGEGDYRTPSASSTPTALLGIPPCDLHALAYLDRVFADDPLYRRRREALVLIGVACEPGKDCFCPPREEPPPFDLFLAEGRVWSGSEVGERLLGGMAEAAGEAQDLPLPDILRRGTGMAVPVDLEDIFKTSRGAPLWREVGERCVSCGACSAVCPTCYCYQVADETLPGGSVTRNREWDNCFFRNHALVAGGRNFRPTRTERLRFRFEHKLLGFGPLRGVSSCVGCGRCRRACPVDIDISEVLSALTGEAQG